MSLWCSYRLLKEFHQDQTHQPTRKCVCEPRQNCLSTSSPEVICAKILSDPPQRPAAIEMRRVKTGCLPCRGRRRKCMLQTVNKYDRNSNADSQPNDMLTKTLQATKTDRSASIVPNEELRASTRISKISYYIEIPVARPMRVLQGPNPAAPQRFSQAITVPKFTLGHRPVHQILSQTM